MFMDLTKLALVLKTTVPKLQMLARETGASIVHRKVADETGSQYTITGAQLTLPLKFPQQRRGR
jgi:hypothetical protein